MGGSSKKKTTQTYTPPSWVEGTSRQAISLGQSLGRQQYEEYGGERIAGLSDNEQEALRLAGANVGAYQPYFDTASSLAGRGTQQFSEADMSQYINPYVKGALDPAAREIREEGSRDIMALEGRAASMDAFGGSRAALARSESRERTLQTIEDLYGKGYKDAWDFGVRTWGEERVRDLEAAGRFQMLGEGAQAAGVTDISTLMTTGAMDRNIQQAMLDFDYDQWREERDWGLRQLGTLIAALEGTKGSYSTTQTTKTKVKSDNTAEIIGGIAQVAGAMIMASDERLKDNIVHLGRGIYTWTWNAIAKSLGYDIFPTIGVIAQEHPELAFEGPHGYLMVNLGGNHVTA